MEIEDSKEWGSELKEFINVTLSYIEKNINSHDQARRYFRSQDKFWRYPHLVVPGVFACLSLLLKAADAENCQESYSCPSEITNTIGFAAILMINSVYSLNFKGKAERHANFTARYSDLKTDIKSEITKKKNHRLPPDVFITKTTMTLDNLKYYEPDIPNHIREQR